LFVITFETEEARFLCLDPAGVTKILLLARVTSLPTRDVTPVNFLPVAKGAMPPVVGEEFFLLATRANEIFAPYSINFDIIRVLHVLLLVFLFPIPIRRRRTPFMKSSGEKHSIYSPLKSERECEFQSCSLRSS